MQYIINTNSSFNYGTLLLFLLSVVSLFLMGSTLHLNLLRDRRFSSKEYILLGLVYNQVHFESSRGVEAEQ